MSRAPIALLVGAAGALLAATQPISDPDVFWHLATGRETALHGLVRADLFSWTVRGAPVSTDQWLGQLALYGAYLAGDWRGVAIVRVLAVAALLALVAVNASFGSRRPLAMVLGAAPALVLTRAVWVDRPELLGLVCFAALLVCVRRVRDGDDRATFACAAIVVVWANVHGSFALGVVVVLLACAEGALRDRVRRRGYVACALATLVATLATPAGIGVWTAPGAHLLSPPRDIQEWGVVDVRTPLGAAYVVVLAGLITCALLGPRVAPRDLFVLVPVAFLSLTALRQAPLLAIVAAPLFADRIERLVAVVLARTPRAVAGSGEEPGARRALVRAIPALALLAAALAIAPGSVDERAYPTGALAALPRGDGVLARYEWGGWLIWRAPATPVFVDGRLTPYLGGVLADYRRVIAAAPGWQDVVARRGVRALLVRPSDPVAVRARELGWHESATAEGFVLIAVR